MPGWRIVYLPVLTIKLCETQSSCVACRYSRTENNDPFFSWSDCSRSCGGGIRRSVRQCDSPAPEHGGLYCVGDRVRYESCNTWDCPRGSKDFRLEQCEDFNGKNFDIEGISENVKWVPKYTGIVGADRCKLFCRVEDLSAYYLLSATVIDGTPCGPNTFHTCVNGQCIPAGCDHVLGSGKQLDWCGICGGDNSTCQEESGIYNQTEYGYHRVVRIPSGATNIEIRQHGFRRNSKDDTYIALRDVDTGDYILNGDFVMSMFRKTIQYGGIMLEYSGSDTVVERVNSSKPLRKDLDVEVLTVGNLYPPQVYFRYIISRSNKESYKWKMLPKWSHCDKLCKGKQTSNAVCVQSQPGYEVEVDDKFCDYLPRLEPKTKDCNMHCSLSWRVKSRSACSTKCGAGSQTLEHKCVQVMANQQEVPLPDSYCEDDLTKPAAIITCEGPCEGVKWSYGHWSECSRTCGGGIQFRKAACVDGDGNPLKEEKCFALKAVTEKECGIENCPKWMFGDWTRCNVSCGSGVRQRPYWCEVDDKKIDGRYCANETVPTHIEICVEKPCTTWYIGDWAKCSAQCGPGSRTRDVHCQAGGVRVEDHLCAGLDRPEDESMCVSYECDEDNEVDKQEIDEEDEAFTEEDDEPLDDTGSNVLKQQTENSVLIRTYNEGLRYRWKVGPWRHCSLDCGGGTQLRAVACFDTTNNDRVNTWKCKRKRPKPKDLRSCNLEACPTGKWIQGEWSLCSVTCGKGIRIRSVSCVDKDSGQLLREASCSGTPPAADEECLDNPPCRHQVPQSSHVEHNDEDKRTSEFAWRKGEWGKCSRTCGGGVKIRQVVCLDGSGRPGDGCDEQRRAPKEVSCNTEPCPGWNFGGWGQCDKPCGSGIQHRLVRCQDHLGQTLKDVECDLVDRPHRTRRCNTQACRRTRRPKYHWRRSAWTKCSKSCDRGVKTRVVQCVDINAGGKQVDDARCLRFLGGKKKKKPKSRKKCNAFSCPFQWVPGQWSKCTHTCGKGVQHRGVSCHRVNAYDWVDPDPVSHGCNITEKPQDIQTCVVNDCEAKFMWKPEPWGQCSWSGRQCGKPGFQRRKLTCVTADGSKLKKRICKRHLPKSKRPQRKRKCQRKICGYENCLDLKLKTGISLDGEYSILFAGKNITVYCHEMNSSMPEEYVTLPAGEQENYSEIYGLRLIQPNSCPYNGTRSSNCDCVADAKRREGFTMFSKIKVNVTSLKVNTHDFTFATQVRGQLVPYGEAGDCYSTANCPQGRFSINLVGTGLRVSPYTGWVGQGNRPSLWLQKVSDNQMLYGKCGGYCGTCTPEPHNGLKLDLVPP